MSRLLSVFSPILHTQTTTSWTENCAESMKGRTWPTIRAVEPDAQTRNATRLVAIVRRHWPGQAAAQTEWATCMPWRDTLRNLDWPSRADQGAHPAARDAARYRGGAWAQGPATARGRAGQRAGMRPGDGAQSEARLRRAGPRPGYGARACGQGRGPVRRGPAGRDAALRRRPRPEARLRRAGVRPGTRPRTARASGQGCGPATARAVRGPATARGPAARSCAARLGASPARQRPTRRWDGGRWRECGGSWPLALRDDHAV
jgi:hypothetical protein